MRRLVITGIVTAAAALAGYAYGSGGHDPADPFAGDTTAEVWSQTERVPPRH